MHINIFLNIILKKIDFDIYLFYILIHNRCKREDRLIIYKLYYRRENVIIITTLLLFEFLNHLTCFIMNNFPREVSLYNIYLIIFQNINL